MQEVDLQERYEIEKKLGTGRFGNIHRARHRQSGATIALKIFPRNSKEIRQSDFIREYNTTLFLSAHQNIIDTYEGAYFTPEMYFFVQELSACGSLRDIVQNQYANVGLCEEYCKKIFKQVLAALQFIHAEGLVHRNIQAKNVLVYDPRFSRIKLADFGLTRKEKTMVKHFDVANPYHAPELCDVVQKEMYAVDKSVDIWALGILMFFALRGRHPWDQAKFSSQAYWDWKEWVAAKSFNVPLQFAGNFTERLTKFFKKTLHPCAKDRRTVKELKKCIEYQWLKTEAGEKCCSDEESASTKMDYYIHSQNSARQKAAATQQHRSSDAEFQAKPNGFVRGWLRSTFRTGGNGNKKRSASFVVNNEH